MEEAGASTSGAFLPPKKLNSSAKRREIRAPTLWVSGPVWSAGACADAAEAAVFSSLAAAAATGDAAAAAGTPAAAAGAASPIADGARGATDGAAAASAGAAASGVPDRTGTGAADVAAPAAPRP